MSAAVATLRARWAPFLAAGAPFWTRVFVMDFWVALLLPVWFKPAQVVWHLNLAPPYDGLVHGAIVAGQFFIPLALVLGRALFLPWLSFAGLFVFMLILRRVAFDVAVGHALAAYCLALLPVFFNDAVTRDAPGSPLHLHRSRVLIDFALATVYTASGISKVLALPGWAEPDTLRDYLYKMVLYQSANFPEVTRWAIQSSWFTYAMAFGTIALEVAAVAIPLLPHNYRCALRLSFFFLHLGIGTLMGLPFFLVMGLILWATWIDVRTFRFARESGFDAPFVR